jgi:hypothetical protein
MDVLRRCGSGGACLMALACGALEKRLRNLGAPGVLDANKEDMRHGPLILPTPTVERAGHQTFTRR